MILGLDSRVIYGLCDPRDGLIRYVGVTKNPAYRLSEHLRMPVKEGIAKNTWIADLLSKELTPIFVFLEAVKEEDASACEQEWIESFAKLGVLFNHKVKSGKWKKKLPK
jgi:hypothetical protein